MSEEQPSSPRPVESQTPLPTSESPFPAQPSVRAVEDYQEAQIAKVAKPAGGSGFLANVRKRLGL